jgi:diguanylate cyclase (GGDEF)-like protein
MRTTIFGGPAAYSDAVALPTARLARVLAPYVAMWILLAAAIVALAWYEIASARADAVTAGRLQTENVARTDKELSALAAANERELLRHQRRYARGIAAFALLAIASLTIPVVLLARRALREASEPGRFDAATTAERVHARTDPLTGAANRRAFDEVLKRCHADLAELKQPFVLAFIDVDRFKRLNDTHGHVVGDRALKRIASTLATTIRRSDLIARLGGDEFAVLMPNADGRAMRRPFDAMFTALTVAMAGEGWPVSFNIVVIAFESPFAASQEATELTDKLMYAVKAAGRQGVRYTVYRDGRLHPNVGVGSADEDVPV